MTALESTKGGMFKNENPISENKQIEVGHGKNQESMLRTGSKKLRKKRKEKRRKKERIREYWTISRPLVSLVKLHVGRNFIKIVESSR